MIDDNPRSTAKLAGRPIHAMLVPFPIACFVMTFVTDILYWKTELGLWETISVWLLTAGLIVAAFAVLAGLIDFVGSRKIRALKEAWLHGLGNAVALILSLINVFVHSRDGYTAVVPDGLILSGLVVLILAFTCWQGWAMVYRQRVGVTN
jgi:uncharacterized membrane protein